MKKVFLAFLGFILVIITLHISTPFYGGVPGIVSRIQARVVNKAVEVVHDPGGCALIRGYWSRGLYGRLRDKCVTNYIQNVVTGVEDCQKTELISDMSTLSRIWLRDEYRYTCLIRHYQAMLGNSITQEWLPDQCINLRDKLVIFEHYLDDIRVERVNKNSMSDSPLSDSEIDQIEQCEGFIDTEKVYSFLRDSGVSEAEKNYIEAEKKKTFELK